MRIEAHMLSRDIILPATGAPNGNYVPWVREGNLVVISGQVPLQNGKPAFIGKVGAELSPEDAYAAARLCALNVVAHLRDACDGDLDRVGRIVRLGGFVNATDDFTEHPKVINGASDLMVEIFGDAGRHARAAVGCSSLPRGVPVEIEALVQLKNEDGRPR